MRSSIILSLATLVLCVSAVAQDDKKEVISFSGSGDGPECRPHAEHPSHDSLPTRHRDPLTVRTPAKKRPDPLRVNVALGRFRLGGDAEPRVH